MVGRSNTCSINITVNRKESYQCQNGGIIEVSEDGSFSCTCPDGFSGFTCGKQNGVVLPCQEGWLPFQESCYKFQTTKMTWSDARANCKALGADLVVVRNQEENDFLYANSPATGDVWIGLSDMGSEADFTWVSTECSQYKNFGYGEPNNYGNGEDCVELDSTNSDNWNDSPCNIRRSYVCEISNFEDREPPSYGSTCPQDIHLLTKPNERRVNVFWQPPVWTDDSSCFASTTSSSFSPGEFIEIPNGVLGTTINVEYTATDMVGRSNACSFKITVSSTNNQCRNGGKIETSDDGLLSCICTEGFSGLTCEIRNSTDNQCQNGGKIKTTDDGFLYCICTEGFSGLKCETRNNTGVNITENNDREAEAQSSNKGTIENLNDQVSLAVAVVGLAITVLILIGIIIKLVRQNHKYYNYTNEKESSIPMEMEVNKVFDETPTTLLL
ncbi:uncharacterized protein [Antedon mediterranea]|uniref:uncharacterized protein n=1 Tax=Antedon mediterranea TaxID=105859 RepID=UPI003AF46E2C